MEILRYLKLAEVDECTILDSCPLPKSQGLRSSLRRCRIVAGWPSRMEANGVVERDQDVLDDTPTSRKNLLRFEKL
jgi:hypothetical protein